MANGTETVKLFASDLGQYHATVGSNGAVRAFTKKGDQFEAAGEYASGFGAVVAVRFAPPQYHPYMLVVGDERGLMVFNLGEKSAKALLSHNHEDAEIGSFTDGEFIDGPCDSLVFVVGTTTGVGLLFSSEELFAPQRIELASAAVRTLATGHDRALAVASVGDFPRLYPEGPLGPYFVFGEGEHCGRNASHLAFPRGLCSSGEMLISADEEGKVVLWKLPGKESPPQMVASFETDTLPSAVCWNLSGLSALIVGVSNNTDASVCLRLERDFDEVEEAKAWSVVEMPATDA